VKKLYLGAFSENERNYEEYDEYIKTNFSNSCCSTRDSSKTKDTGNYRYDKKSDGPS